MAVVAGVDIGKSSLDVSVSEGPVLRFDNTAKGITKLLKHLTKQEATLAVCESTGGYERLLVSRLRKAEIGVRVANPGRVRAFAKACGYEAKTDPRDAQVLSRYGQVFPESDTPATDPEREELQDLLRRRRQLVEQRVQEATGWTRAGRVECHSHAGGEGVPGGVAGAPPWPSGQRYRTVPGVGPLTAATLAPFCPKTQGDLLGGTGALVGKRGQRAIRGGRGSAQSPLSLCLLGDPGRGRVTQFLPKPAPARETRQRGLGSRDAPSCCCS